MPLYMKFPEPLGTSLSRYEKSPGTWMIQNAPPAASVHPIVLSLSRIPMMNISPSEKLSISPILRQPRQSMPLNPSIACF